MAWVTVVVQWAHVALAILWVGIAVTVGVVLTPVSAALSLPEQRAFGLRLGKRVGPLFGIAGGGTMLLGILRGTVFGPLHSLGAFTSMYGLTWIVALLLTVAVAILGGGPLGAGAERLYADDALWQAAPDGGLSSALAAAQQRLHVLARWELGGFAAILALMVLMAAGY